MAIEHLLFGTIRFVAQRHPELLDELDGSLDHLWDLVDEEPRNDEAVREVARRFLKSLRAESGGSARSPPPPAPRPPGARNPPLSRGLRHRPAGGPVEQLHGVDDGDRRAL